MCNLYSQKKSRAEVARWFRISDNRAGAFEPSDAIFPGHSAPVVRHAEDGEREIVSMGWGFVLPQPGKAPRRISNVRDDKILASRFWRDSFHDRRCLVPATSFCEPNSAVKPATWHWFALKGEGERPIFAFAGIWRRHRGPLKKDGPVLETDVYSFLTTTPTSLTNAINQERYLDSCQRLAVCRT